jgi:hypothetical protein
MNKTTLGVGALIIGIALGYLAAGVIDTASMTIHEGTDYSIEVLEGYEVTPATDTIMWTTIENENGSIQIWDTDDLPERAIGFGEGVTDDQVDFGLPKLSGTLGHGRDFEKAVRVQYMTGDMETAMELYDMIASFEGLAE